MRLINKKSLIFLTSILLVIISVLVIKQTKPVELSDVKLLEASNDISFAMYKKTDTGYEEYKSEMFPHGYTLNLDESKCIDSTGNEIKNVLSYEHNQVKLTSNKTSYCYLYFDEKENINNVCNGTNMQECISNKKEEIKAIENLSTELKGDMYRYQGLAIDVDNNYICFGTNKQQDCVEHPDQYMYRIIGIEESGRIKVIKKEALDQTYQWYTDYVTDVKLPNSVFFQGINGTDFLDNTTYIPEGWKDKISDNNWLYGDMWENDTDGAKQMGAGLYETESGKKSANWNIWSTKEEGGISKQVGIDDNPIHPKGTILYYKTVSGTWTDIVNSKKISLMYLHDYSYAVGDEAKCDFYYGEEEYAKCKLGWMHLSNNDSSVPSVDEWTMTRHGWWPWGGTYDGFYISSSGFFDNGARFVSGLSVRPVFYIDSNQIIESGLGSIDNPYIIK